MESSGMDELWVSDHGFDVQKHVLLEDLITVWFSLTEESTEDFQPVEGSPVYTVADFSRSFGPLEQEESSSWSDLSQYSVERSQGTPSLYSSSCKVSSHSLSNMDPNTNETYSTNDSQEVSSSVHETTGTSDGNSASHLGLEDASASSSVQDSAHDEVVHSAIMEVSGELILGKFSPQKYPSAGSESSDISDEDRGGQHRHGGSIAKYPESSTGLSDTDWNPYATESDTNHTPRSNGSDEQKVVDILSSSVPQKLKDTDKLDRMWETKKERNPRVDGHAVALDAREQRIYRSECTMSRPETAGGDNASGQKHGRLDVLRYMMDSDEKQKIPGDIVTGPDRQTDVKKFNITSELLKETESKDTPDPDSMRTSTESGVSTKSNQSTLRAESNGSPHSYKSGHSQLSYRETDRKWKSPEVAQSPKSEHSSLEGEDYRRVSAESGQSLQSYHSSLDTEDTRRVSAESGYSLKTDGSGTRSGRPSAESGISPRYSLDRSDTTNSVSRRESAESGRSDRSGRTGNSEENRRTSAESGQSLRSDKSRGTENSADTRRDSAESTGSVQSLRSDRLDQLSDAGQNIQALIQSETSQRISSERALLDSKTDPKHNSSEPQGQSKMAASLGAYRTSYIPDMSVQKIDDKDYVSVSQRERLLSDSPHTVGLQDRYLPEPSKEYGLSHKPEVTFDRYGNAARTATGVEQSDGSRSPSDISMKRVAQIFEETKKQVRAAVSLPRPDPSGSEERFPLRERLSMSQHTEDSFLSKSRREMSVTSEKSDIQHDKSRDSETRSITSDEVARVLGKQQPERQRSPYTTQLTTDSQKESPIRVSAFDRVEPQVKVRDTGSEEISPPVTEMSDDEIARRVRAILSDTSHLGTGKALGKSSLGQPIAASALVNGYTPHNMDYKSLERDLQEIQDSLTGPDVPLPKANDSLHFMFKQSRTSAPERSSTSDQDTFKSAETTSGEGESSKGRRLLWDHAADLGYNEEYAGQFLGTMTETDTNTLSHQLTTMGSRGSENLVVRPDSSTTNETENDVPDIEPETLTASDSENLFNQVLNRQAEGNLTENVEDIIAKYRNQRRDLFERFQPENDRQQNRVFKLPDAEAAQPSIKNATATVTHMTNETASGSQSEPGLAQRIQNILSSETQKYQQPLPNGQSGLAKEVYKILTEDRPDQQVNGILTDAKEQEQKLLKRLAEQPRVDTSCEEFSLDSTTNTSFGVPEEEIRRQLEWSKLCSPEKNPQGLTPGNKTGMSDLDAIKEMTSAPYSAFNNAKTFLSSQLKKMSEQNFDKSVELRTPCRQVLDCYPVYGVEREKKRTADVTEAWNQRRPADDNNSGKKADRNVRPDKLASERFFLTSQDVTPPKSRFYGPDEVPRQRTYSDPFEISPVRRTFGQERSNHARSKSEEGAMISDLSQYSMSETSLSGSDRRASSSPHKMRRLQEEEVDVARRQTAVDFTQTPKKSSHHLVQADWSCECYSYSDTSDRCYHSDSSDILPSGNQWRYYGYQLYGPGNQNKIKYDIKDPFRQDFMCLASGDEGPSKRRLSRSLETERNKYVPQGHTSPSTAGLTGHRRLSRSVESRSRRDMFDLELERKVLAHEGYSCNERNDLKHGTNDVQLLEMLSYDRHRYNFPLELPFVEEDMVVQPTERPSRSREKRINGKVLNDKKICRQVSVDESRKWPFKSPSPPRRVAKQGQGQVRMSPVKSIGQKDNSGHLQKQDFTVCGNLPQERNKLQNASNQPMSPIKRGQKFRGHDSRYGNQKQRMNPSGGKRFYPVRETSSSPTESDTSASKKFSKLRPYRPVGSRDVYYTESGDDTNESGTTVESTHPGSDDAIPPYIPSQYLGTRKEEPHRHPTGIYGNKDALSTIDEKSNVDEKERALSDVAVKDSAPMITVNPNLGTRREPGRQTRDSGLGGTENLTLDPRHTTDTLPQNRDPELLKNNPRSEPDRPRSRSPYADQLRSRSPYTDSYQVAGERDQLRSRSPNTFRNERERLTSKSPYSEQNPHRDVYRTLTEREQLLRQELGTGNHNLQPNASSQEDYRTRSGRNDGDKDSYQRSQGRQFHKLQEELPSRLYPEEKLSAIGTSIRSDPGVNVDDPGRKWVETRESVDDLTAFKPLEPEPLYPKDRLRCSHSRSDTNLLDLSPAESQKYSSPMVPGTRFLELSNQPSPIFHHDSVTSLREHRDHGLPVSTVGPPVERSVREMVREHKYPGDTAESDQKLPMELPRVLDRDQSRGRRSPNECPVLDGRQMDSGADPMLTQTKGDSRPVRKSPVDRPGSDRAKSPLHVREKELEKGLEELKKQLDAQINAVHHTKTPEMQGEFEDSFPPSKKAQVLREVLEQDYIENIPPNINDMWTRFQEVANQSQSESSVNSTRLNALADLLKNPTQHTVTSFLKEKQSERERQKMEEHEKLLMLKEQRQRELEEETKTAVEKAVKERNLRRQELQQKHGLSEEESNGSYSEFVMVDKENRRKEKTRKVASSRNKDSTSSPNKQKARKDKERQGSEKKLKRKIAESQSTRDERSRQSDTMDTLFSIPEDASFEGSPGKSMSPMKAKQKRHRHVIDPLMNKLRDKIKLQRDKIDKERRKELVRVEKLKKLEMLLTAKRKGRLSDKAIDVELNNFSTTSVSQSESSASLVESTIVGSTSADSDLSNGSTTLKDSSVEAPRLQVKRYAFMPASQRAPVDDLTTSCNSESSDFNNIIVEKVTPSKPRKNVEKKPGSKGKKAKVDEFGNKIKKDKKDRRKDVKVDGFEDSTDEALAKQLRKYMRMKTPDKNKKDVATMYPSPITVSPPARRRAKEVLMKSEAVQTTPSRSYDEHPVAPVPLMSAERRKTSRSPRRDSPSARQSSSITGRQKSPSPSAVQRKPVIKKKTRPLVPASEIQCPPPKSSMFTPETPDENRAPVDKNLKQVTNSLAWFVPLKPSRPWRQPLKERQAFAVRQEPWEPKSVSQATWKNIIHGDLNKDQTDPADISRDTKFDLDPEGHLIRDEEMESESEESDADVSKSKPLSKMTLQEAFLQMRQDVVSRSRERQKRLALAAEERRMQAYLQMERDQLFHEQRKKEANPEAHPYSDNLFKPTRRTISKEEMKEITMKKYKKLPEVIEKEKLKKRTEDYALNRLKARLFNRKVQKKVLVKADIWGK